MQIKATILLGIGLILVSLPVLGGPPAHAGVTRTQIEGEDNWGWNGGPIAPPTITCPGGELTGAPPDPCSDSMTGRLHVRDGAGWGCVTTDDSRMTGVGRYTSNFNFDAESNGPVWGELKIVPFVGCNKDAVYADEYEALVENATSYWHGTWNGQREFDSNKNAWVGELKVVAKGFGEGLDGLHFKGTMWITTFTPFPLAYEYIFPPESDMFGMPEAEFIGTIKD